MTPFPFFLRSYLIWNDPCQWDFALQLFFSFLSFYQFIQLSFQEKPWGRRLRRWISLISVG